MSLLLITGIFDMEKKNTPSILEQHKNPEIFDKKYKTYQIQSSIAQI